MSFTGTDAEPDGQLPDVIVSFVAGHLELKNTLDRAKEEMAASAKAAQEEARNKSKTAKKAVPAAVPVHNEERKMAEPPKPPGLCGALLPLVGKAGITIAGIPRANQPCFLRRFGLLSPSENWAKGFPKSSPSENGGAAMHTIRRRLQSG